MSVDAAQLRALLAAAPTDPRIRYVSPLGPRRGCVGMPNDPLVQADRSGDRPAVRVAVRRRARRPRARPLAGDPAIVVGIIDTGVGAVPDLAGKIDSLWTVAPDGTVTPDAVATGNDDTGHGTAVASLIAANVDDGFGMAGFGGATHVIAVHAGYQGFFYDTAVAIALTKLDSLGVRIVNMSLGGPTPSQPILLDAIHKAAADGILLVAATGNDARRRQLARGRSAADRRRAQLRARGRRQRLRRQAAPTSRTAGKHLSLVAPGAYDGTCSGVLVALPPASDFDGSSCYRRWGGAGGAHYGYIAGTSFAAPEVAGIAALIWAARPELDELPGRRHHQAVRPPRRRAGWTPTLGLRRPRRRRGARAGDEPLGAEWAARRQPSEPSAPPTATARRLAQRGEPDDPFAALRDKTLGDRGLQGQRNSFVALAGLVHRERHVHDPPARPSTSPASAFARSSPPRTATRTTTRPAPSRGPSRS